MKVTFVKKARKDQGTCDACHLPILAGQAYKYFQPRFGPAHKRHTACPHWKPSQMVSNEKLSALYAAQEAAEDAINNWNPSPQDKHLDTSELDAILSDAAQDFREVAEMYQESASNIEDGFGHSTSMSEEMTEKAEEIESFADNLESAVFDDPPEKEDDISLDEWEDYVDSWVDECRTEAMSLLDEVPQ